MTQYNSEVIPQGDPPTFNLVELKNSYCPITLEPFCDSDPRHIYTHAGVSYNVFALYTHLSTSVHFCNPVNRVPFSLVELEDIENRIRSLCGPDAITKTNDSDQDDTGSVKLFSDDSALESSVELQVIGPDQIRPDDTITLQVDVRVSDDQSDDKSEEGSCPIRYMHTSQSYSTLTSITSSDVQDDSDIFDLDVFSNISEDDLPPKFSYPSVVEMFKDVSRTRQMVADMDLVQYLNYESADILQQIISLISDDDFHQTVWEQTSPSVTETINRLIEERTNAPDIVQDNSNYNIEIIYGDCWEIYRHHVLRWLRRRYRESITNMNRVSNNDADLCIKSHINIVNDSSKLSPENKEWLLAILSEQNMAILS